MEQTVKVLRRFHRLVQQHGADRVQVVATSALRDARNGNAFLQWVRAATGWQVEVISGLEEGRLIHLGVMAGSRIKTSPMLLVDLGGGSCELTVSVKENIEKIVSLPLGAVRLTREFLRHDPPKKKELKELRAFVAEEIGRVEKAMLQAKVKMTVATSGTPAALSDMWAEREHKNTVTVPRAGLLEITHELSRMTLDQRRQVPGVGERRAEIIIAGAVVFSELLSRLRLPSSATCRWACAMDCWHRWRRNTISGPTCARGWWLSGSGRCTTWGRIMASITGMRSGFAITCCGSSRR